MPMPAARFIAHPDSGMAPSAIGAAHGLEKTPNVPIAIGFRYSARSSPLDIVGPGTCWSRAAGLPWM
jgi:hypothetical protein